VGGTGSFFGNTVTVLENTCYFFSKPEGLLVITM